MALALSQHTALAQPGVVVAASDTPGPTPAPAPAPATTAPAPTPAPQTPAPTPAATPAPAPTTQAPTPAPTPAPSPSLTVQPTPAPTPSPAANATASGSDSGSDDTGVSTVTTKKKTKAPTEAPTPSPEPTSSTVASKTPATKTPTPTATKQKSDTSSSSDDDDDDANSKSSTASSQSRTILMAVIAAVAALSIISLLVLCCRRRSRSGSESDEMVTPVPILASNRNNNNQSNIYGFQPSNVGIDRASGQLRDSKGQLSINTTGYGGLPTTDSGLPKYAVTSPEMPANYRASAHQSRLADFNRRTRTGTMTSLPSVTSPSGSNQASFTNHSATSSFSIRGESEMSVSDRGTGSYASQSSSDLDDSYQPRITANLAMNRFTRTSSMASSSQRGGGAVNVSGDVSFVNHDLTRSVGETATPISGQLQRSAGPSDGKTYYKSIQSPADRVSLERESFEL